MFAQRLTVAVTTDGAGAATSYSTALTGQIKAIVYVKTDFANGVDFAITLEATGETLWTGTNVDASATVYPVTAATVASTGAASVLLQVPIVAANDRVKIIISSGGATKTGTFYVVVT